MADIAKIKPLGSNTEYTLKARILSHTPSNTKTFLRGDNTWSNELSGDILKITNNSNTLSVGSQNGAWCHFTNSADIPFYFNKQIQTTDSFKIYNNGTSLLYGRLELAGGTPYVDFHFNNSTADYTSRLIEDVSGELKITGKLKVSTSTNSYALNAASFRCDSWVLTNGATGWYNDTYGGGWYMSDTTWIRNYNNKQVYLNNFLRVDNHIQAGGETNDTAERQVKVYSGAGPLYLYSLGTSTGNRGLYTPAHGTGTAKNVLVVDTNNNVTFYGTLSGNASSTSSVAWANVTGKPSTFAPSSHNHDSTYVNVTGDTMSGNLTVSKSAAFVIAQDTVSTVRASIHAANSGNHGIYSHGYYNGSAFTSSTAWIIYRNTAGNANSSLKIYGAVWNDYAEYRQSDVNEPGRCIKEIGNGKLILSEKRLEKGCEIISDTFGFAIGQSLTNQTPTAATGRVLAYPYEDKEEFRKNIGQGVCSGPNGTVSIMTDEEIKLWPQCIIGTISEVPDYEIWRCGDQGKEELKINGRVWIRVK